ncbi:ABC-type Fe3+ transport system, periplasmic component [Polaromonas sp. CF318]|uniref:ABC transporter substrate-binding protein n=1 Tax=Polaromonas sp. CF318 TaxID=1144318 RepID=UPI0002711F9E|nr:ABC transporter substrate-binding protein [Polaromonas sp. CF318]EJL77869.1 ABC-type Fe3+ transport system, periplasmic component [Polaromonas sp. CF318]
MKHVFKQSLLVLAASGFTMLAHAQVPAGYPASYQAVIDGAKKEGKVLIYTPTDAAAGRPLVREFEAMYPGVKVEYSDMNTTELFNRFISETAAGAGSADVVWSSAMDQQLKLVNENYSAPYESPEAKNLPKWAVYKNTAYGTTFEPVGIVYNKRLLKEAEVPATRADFMKLLKSDPTRFQGKVTSFDIEKSGSGFLFLSNDVKLSPNTWEVIKTMAGSGVKLQSSSGTMMERISSGENIIGYNMFLSYAHARAKKDASIGYAYLKDYTLVFSRVAFISKTAKNPNAAKLWLDYLLSKKGQTTLSTASELYSIRSDVEGETTMAALTKQLGSNLKPIAIDDNLLTYLDQTKRVEFLKQWQQNVKK